ncbi:MAG: DUF177 domain-containing protein [Alphaproteobacteria bacterium]|nr:DUF177 domain-containing protein [Alphaproteobacteria bacterium]
MPKRSPEPEFSRIVCVDALPEGEATLELEASAAECAALACRFALEAVASVRAQARLVSRRGGREVMAEIAFVADVVQLCVITLDPVAAQVEDRVALRFVATEAADGVLARDKELVVAFDDDDVEPLVGGVIDLGEVVAEHLALALDPYPRKPGAHFERAGEDDRAGAESPFAVLGRLRQA